MDSIFGRKKPKNNERERARQVSSASTELSERSVPYDKLGPAGRAPIPISAPITNPTLTDDGTEFNVYQMKKSRAERERMYAQVRMQQEAQAMGLGQSQGQGQGQSNQGQYGQVPESPATSESSTAWDNNSSVLSTPTPASRRSGAGARMSRSSNVSSSSTYDKARSPMTADFNAVPSPTMSAYRGMTPTSATGFNTSFNTDRPVSNTPSRATSNRYSGYAPSIAGGSSATTETQHNRHLSHHFHLRNQDAFDFPRPVHAEEIEALFEQMLERRDLEELRGKNMPLDQKWQLVWSDEHTRWSEAQKGPTQVPDAARTADVEGSPLWYIKKFMDKTITHKQAQGLPVSLRSHDIS
jgi:cytokinesis protein